MKLFDLTNDSKIILEENTAEAILLAAQDLQDNLRRLSERSRGFEIINDQCEHGILIKTQPGNSPEKYMITIDEEKVTIIGTDTLGTVFGIYAFAAKFLNISPVYRLTDLFPECLEKLILEPQILSSDERPVRFRGWFINDEDLLTDWKISGGHRHIAYPFYQNVMDEAVLGMIIETALRLEMNLMIPSSFVDIDNPDEEKLVREVCRRGMYVSQHHIEPMGVSYFTADNYLKKHGYENEKVSFTGNRSRMEEIWDYYAKKWAKYGEQVVWQLGLRGKGDEAVWKSDPNVPISMEKRGAVITDAINTQYEIIRKTLGTDHFCSTATLWNEGSELYGSGYLKLPETTVPVFADFGVDQMFGEDLFRIGYQTNTKYGVYYHAAFWDRGPHLAEGCDPEKMAYNYRNAAKDGRLYYSILNISNVRPLHISAVINARILKSPIDFRSKDELLRLDCELFGKMGETVNNLRCEYYSSFADFGTEMLKKTAKEWHFYYHEYEPLPFIRNAVTDGHLYCFCRYLLNDNHSELLPEFNEKTMKLLAESAERFEKLYCKAEETEKLIPETRRLYFRQFLAYQIRYMQRFTAWCVSCMRMMDETMSSKKRKQHGALALYQLERILEERKILELGEWQNWHRGDKKIGIIRLAELTEKVYNEIKD